ncbi:hypothetical protein DYB32_010200 [Aphanomyces invadans]|uniref:Uncharacterized protein n=1 Tax=Aphanomyces invadans TaxID=157072 RepID=A0A418AGJ6_9STRA|nr:hypothetical protein DYB32_010200 [Aphanomyces invadans]
MKSLDATAARVLQIDGLGRKSLDGKKAAQRFGLLVEAHCQFLAKSKFMSGSSQEENEKTQLLNELVALVDGHRSIKVETKASHAAEREKVESATSMIRDEAMQRSSKRKTDPEDDGSSSTKKKSLTDMQQAEIDMEMQKSKYKKMKIQAEIDEKALAARSAQKRVS